MSRTVNAVSHADSARWALTPTDLVLCALPIGLFLSIVSFI